MIVRTAVAGCLFAVLMVPAAALAVPAVAGVPITDDVAAGTRQAKRKPEPVRAFILPPRRPAPGLQEEQAGSPEGVEQSDRQAASLDGFQLDPPSTGPARAIAVLPPLRPSFMDVPPGLEPATIVAARQPPDPPHRPDGWIAPPSPRLSTPVLPPERPAFAWDDEPIETASLPDSGVAVLPPPRIEISVATLPDLVPSATSGREALDQLISSHARLNAVPPALVHRVVVRESRYNPRAVGRGGAMGLMQIKHATARAMGYGGTSAGLLDAETNLTYAVRYLAGAYRVAGGDFDRAVMNYARGYYYEAKRQRMREPATAPSDRVREADAERAIQAAADASPALARPPVGSSFVDR